MSADGYWLSYSHVPVANNTYWQKTNADTVCFRIPFTRSPKWEGPWEASLLVYEKLPASRIISLKPNSQSRPFPAHLKAMKTTRHPKRQASAHPYESTGETQAAVGRIRAQFENTKNSLAEEKEYDASPEGVLRSTLQALLCARKAMNSARRELDVAIVTLRRVLPKQ